MNNPLVSVNLLLYKPGIYLEPCLKSVLAQTYGNLELLIIDNNSQDNTVERADKIIKEASGHSQRIPFCRIIVNKKNLGFAGGHNFGIKQSRGELVFFLNQDIILENDYIKNIVEVFAKDEKIGSAQGKLLRLKPDGHNLAKTEIIDNTGLLFLKNRRILARGQGRPDEGQFDRVEEIFLIDGAAPIFRRQALEDVAIRVDPRYFSGSASDQRLEYLDESFFLYKEDIDLGWRLRLYGWKAFYVPLAVAWHARTAGDSAATSYLGIIRERLKINKFAKYQSFKNQRLMQVKNESFWLLFKHLPWFLPKEIGAWAYVFIFERFTWRAIRELFRQVPMAWRKRKIIMANKKVSGREMEKWFR